MAANTLLTLTKITPKALMVLENANTFTRTINRQYSKEFAVAGAQIGATINIRRPAQFTVSTGPALAPQAITESYIPLTLSYQDHVDINITSADLALDVNDFSELVLEPAVAALANKIDDRLAGIATLGTANYFGSAGSNSVSYNSYLQAAAILDNEAVPQDRRFGAISANSAALLRDNLKGLLRPASFLDELFTSGQFYGNMDGINMLMDQNMQTLTSGVQGGTPVTAAAVGINTGWAATSTFSSTGWSSGASTLNAGDIIYFGTGATAALPVNPQNRRVYSAAQRPFTVVTTTSDVTGTMSITVSPAVIYGGQFQNVNIQVGSGATITTVATTGQVVRNDLVYHRDAYTIGFADLPIVGGVDMCVRRVDKKSGVSMRATRQYTIQDDSLPTRLDVLYGGAVIRDTLGCRVLS